MNSKGNFIKKDSCPGVHAKRKQKTKGYSLSENFFGPLKYNKFHLNEFLAGSILQNEPAG